MNTSRFFFICTAASFLLSTTVNAESLTHVASLTFEDTAGNAKTQLERTTPSNCSRKLRAITRDANAQPGITRIVSSKCGEVIALIGFFERKSMGVPYITIGDNSVLILRGASKRVCNNAALLARQMDNNSTCVFPSKVYK